MEYSLRSYVCVFVDTYVQVHTGKLFYLAIRITLPPDRFAWIRAPQRSPLFKFAVTGGPHVLCLCIAVAV